jgi:xanthine dehydrogenase molybdopterin-binding subunit B
MVGNACLDSARKLRHEIAATLANRWGCERDQIVLAEGRAFTTRDPERESMEVAEAFRLTEARIGTLGSVGWYQSPKLGATIAVARSAPRRRTRSPPTWSKSSAIPRPAWSRCARCGLRTTVAAR